MCSFIYMNIYWVPAMCQVLFSLLGICEWTKQRRNKGMVWTTVLNFHNINMSSNHFHPKLPRTLTRWKHHGIYLLVPILSSEVQTPNPDYGICKMLGSCPSLHRELPGALQIVSGFPLPCLEIRVWGSPLNDWRYRYWSKLLLLWFYQIFKVICLPS